VRRVRAVLRLRSSLAPVVAGKFAKKQAYG